MGKITIVIDGMENQDYKLLSSLAGISPAGKRNNTPYGMETDSLNCIMTLLGVAKQDIPSGRSALEAMAAGIAIENDDLVFRGNSVLIEKGVLLSSCAKGEISLIEDNRFEIKPIGGYKYLIVLKHGKPFLNSIKTFLPHQSLGKDVKELMPQGDSLVRDILKELILKYAIFPWAPSIMQEIPSFEALNKIKGAMVAKTEIAVGIARAMNMHCEIPKLATADTDTDLKSKAEFALQLLKKYEYVMLHINGADECSHRKNEQEKHAFIKRIDKELLSLIINNAPKKTTFEITADHETSVKTGCHINSEVAYYTL